MDDEEITCLRIRQGKLRTAQLSICVKDSNFLAYQVQLRRISVGLI